MSLCSIGWRSSAGERGGAKDVLILMLLGQSRDELEMF